MTSEDAETHSNSYGDLGRFSLWQQKQQWVSTAQRRESALGGESDRIRENLLGTKVGVGRRGIRV